MLEEARRRAQGFMRVGFYGGIKPRGEARPPCLPTLVKLRISSHKLKIKTGRYDNIPRDEMLCSLCDCNRIDDETHFLLDSKFFFDKRDVFL